MSCLNPLAVELPRRRLRTVSIRLLGHFVYKTAKSHLFINAFGRGSLCVYVMPLAAPQRCYLGEKQDEA